MADSVMRILLALSIALCPAVASAGDLPDPTRPPAFLMGLATALCQGNGHPSSGLQSTIISESRRAAIIDGKTVELWAKHGNAQLIEVNEGSVVLRTAQTRRILTLFPDVKMTHREIESGRASPENRVQPEEIGNTPAEYYEKPLSGHPKEKK